MVAAAVAAGVAVAATAASAAMQASQGGPDIPGMTGASGLEARVRRRQFGLLEGAQQSTERGAFERNLVTPELYRLAGYEPEYDEASLGAAASSRAAADAAAERFAEAQAAKEAYSGKSFQRLKKATVAGLKGRARQQALKELRKDKKSRRHDLRISRKESDTAAETAAGLESRAGRITGLKRTGLGTPEEQEFERLLQERALNAARTGESNDPRLMRELAEEEGTIRARLRRQFGADYENSTAGRSALNAFRQRAVESKTEFGRKDLALAGEALKHRATLGDIAGQQIGLSLAPSQARMSTGESMGNLASRFQEFGKMLQQDRLATHGIKVNQALAEHQAEAQRTQAISGALSSLARGAGSYAGAGV